MPKLKKLHRAILTFDDGTSVEVDRIGQGRYTTAWRNSHSVYLQTKNDEYSKEIMEALFDADKGQNPHLPQCKALPYWAEDGPYRWYTMPVYQKLTAANKQAWAEFRELEALRQKAMSKMPRYPKGWMARDLNKAFAELVHDSLALSSAIKEAVQMIVDEAANYGEYLVEIARHNIMVDGNENLVFVDPVFDWEELQTARRLQAKKQKGY